MSDALSAADLNQLFVWRTYADAEQEATAFNERAELISRLADESGSSSESGSGSSSSNLAALAATCISSALTKPAADGVDAGGLGGSSTLTTTDAAAILAADTTAWPPPEAALAQPATLMMRPWEIQRAEVQEAMLTPAVRKGALEPPDKHAAMAEAEAMAEGSAAARSERLLPSGAPAASAAARHAEVSPAAFSPADAKAAEAASGGAAWAEAGGGERASGAAMSAAPDTSGSDVLAALPTACASAPKERWPAQCGGCSVCKLLMASDGLRWLPMASDGF